MTATGTTSRSQGHQRKLKIARTHASVIRRSVREALSPWTPGELAHIKDEILSLLAELQATLVTIDYKSIETQQTNGPHPKLFRL